jgi:hypothetical protein
VKIIGCDLHARQQTLAMLDTNTGEVVMRTLQHEGNNVREFYSSPNSSFAGNDGRPPEVPSAHRGIQLAFRSEPPCNLRPITSLLRHTVFDENK